MTEQELLNVIEQEERQALSAATGLLAEQRRQALAYYFGEKYGNEVEGRSQVVTTEVKDAVEAIMPSLMSIFTASDEIVRFDPQGPEDEAGAQQATDYANYAFSRQNDGFLALYCLFKDALLLKNGYVKVYWDEYEDSGIESYEKLTDDEFNALSRDEELELEEDNAYEDPQFSQMIEQQAALAAARGMQLPPIPVPMLHDAKFRRTRQVGKICISPVPPDQVLISSDATNKLSGARFVEHRQKFTISQIREMGFKIDDDISDVAESTGDNMEAFQRAKFDNAMAFDQHEPSIDPATREVWLREAYRHLDYDGDGIAEFRKITVVGRTVLENVEFDSHCIIGGTAILMPHKHYGLSVHDLLGEIQLQSSTLLRNIFDNTYLANNGRYAVLDGMANMDDLLTNRPGGIVRMKTLNAVQRLDTPVLGQPAYNLLEYLQTVKQNRVGARDFANAVDPDALNAKAHTAELVTNAAAERINLMARILAEGPVKEIFWKIVELASKHEGKKKTIRLRNQWIEVDPRAWRNKFDMVVTVGLGSGSQAATLNGAKAIMELQGGLVQMGLKDRIVTDANIYRAAHKLAKAVFPKDADGLFTDPATMPEKPPAPDPKIITAQIAAEAQKQIARANLQAEAQSQALKKEFDAEKTKFREMAASVAQEKEHAAQLQQMLLQQSEENKRRMADMLMKVKEAAQQDAANKSGLAMQGVVDSILEQQKHQHAQMEQLLKAHTEAALIEKEIVRDQKTGKATGVRPKAK